MPIIHVRVQSQDFTEPQLDRLAQGLTQAAADAEQIPDDDAHRMATLVLIEEAPRGRQYSAGRRVDLRFVAIEISPPAGVMDQGARNRLFAAVERAVGAASEGGSPAITSVIVREVEHGHWGVGGRTSWLNDFAARAGYRHLTAG